MGTSAFIVHDGSDHLTSLIRSRDIGLLSGPFFQAGVNFSYTYGFYENHTVAGGVPEGSHVTRPARKLFNAALGLSMAIERDFELLKYDYLISLDGKDFHKGPQIVELRGRQALLTTTPKGFCHAQVRSATERIIEYIDFRGGAEFVYDDTLKVYLRRTEAEVGWRAVLPPLLKFLRPRVKKRLIVEHIDRIK